MLYSCGWIVYSSSIAQYWSTSFWGSCTTTCFEYLFNYPCRLCYKYQVPRTPVLDYWSTTTSLHYRYSMETYSCIFQQYCSTVAAQNFNSTPTRNSNCKISLQSTLGASKSALKNSQTTANQGSIDLQAQVVTFKQSTEKPDITLDLSNPSPLLIEEGWCLTRHCFSLCVAFWC